jgi:hypothetical protein
MVVPVQYGKQPTGGDFAKVQANAADVPEAQFQITRAKQYSYATIDGEALEAVTDEGAFVDLLQNRIDNMLNALGDKQAMLLFRGGTAALGQLSSSSSTSGTAFTLAVGTDAQFFEKGTRLYFSPNADGSSQRTGNLYVWGTDPDAGTVTISTSQTGAQAGNLTSITSLATGDYVFAYGDGAGATGGGNSTQIVKGLDAWLPLTVSATTHFGVDRTVSPAGLAGYRINNTGVSIKENVLKLAEKIAAGSGGRPDKCFLHPTNFTNLVNDLGTKVEYSGAGGSATWGWGRIYMETSAGRLEVISDPDCLSTRGYVLQMDSWELASLNDFIRIDEMDGLRVLRQASDDGIEVRGKSYGQLVCRAPGKNGVFAI